MKTAIVKVMALALMAFSFLTVSCNKNSNDDVAGMAEVLGRGDLIVVTDVSDSNFTVLYCKAEGKSIGIVGEEPMFDGERFEFSFDDYTYVGDHEVQFSGKPSVVMQIYAKKSSPHYQLYLELLSIE